MLKFARLRAEMKGEIKWHTHIRSAHADAECSVFIGRNFKT